MKTLIKYIATLLLLAVSQTAYAQTAIIYVKDDSGLDSNDGKSWSSAYKTVGKALSSVTTTPAEIWVAKGNYIITSSLRMMNNVGIYGGFAGIESDKGQRMAGNATILDGDGKRRVFQNMDITSSALLDSVTITNGYVRNDYGGGMQNYNASPTIVNCTFSGNQALDEGVNVGRGGGMGNGLYSSPTIINCTFSGNHAGYSGGGIQNNGYASPIIINCTFSGNTASFTGGGGIYNSDASSPVITNCTFSGNECGTYYGNGGGAIYNNYSSSPTITSCIIWGNTPTTQIYNEGSSSTSQVTYSIVQGGHTGTGNISTNPLLGALASNGGFVQTMSVSGTSSATNAGATHAQATFLGVTLPATDARGYLRSTDISQKQTIGAYDPSAIAATRIIEVSPSSLTFGNLMAGGETKTMAFTIYNYGNSPLTVSGITYPDGFSGNWSGVIISGGSQTVIVKFAPTTVSNYNGTVTVRADNTSGISIFTVSGTGIVTERPPLSVYETKVSARTSVIKEMSVKIEYRDPANGLLKTKNFPVHYRAPVTKSYTILMAYDGDGSTVYPNTGSGRMWTTGLKPAFKFGGESYLHKGWTAEGMPSHIGAKRQNIPEQGRYFNIAPNTPEIHFTGLATLDWKNGGRVASSTGVVYGKNFAPLRCTKHTTLEQGQPEPWQAAMTLGWESKSLYYPQPCYVEGSGGAGGGDLKEAHFHGTYKTRYHAKRSKDLYWPMVNTQMDTLWVPKANR